MKHTKGPWSVTTAWQKSKYNIRGPDGNALADVMNKHRSNAHLISAAPEMLDALEVVQRYLDKNELQIDGQRASIDCVLLAIKKAKGE